MGDEWIETKVFYPKKHMRNTRKVIKKLKNGY